MLKSLRAYSLICFLSLASNLVGNLIWTYSWQKEKIEFASDEEDSDTDTDTNKSNKRGDGVNLLEEELHLEEAIYAFNFSIYLFSKSGFSNDTGKPIGQDQIPLENPPESIKAIHLNSTLS